MTQRVAINGIAESMMAFNTNYKDTGLFGVFATAEVRFISNVMSMMWRIKVVIDGEAIDLYQHTFNWHVYQYARLFPS